MTERARDIRITSRLIEFESRIVSVAQIASVYIGPDPERQARGRTQFRLGIIMVAVGMLVLFINAPAARFSRFDATMAIGLTMFGAGVALIVLSAMFKGSVLVISTADSRFAILAHPDAGFLAEVLSRIRSAMLAEPASLAGWHADLGAGKIVSADSGPRPAAAAVPAAQVSPATLNADAAAPAPVVAAGALNGAHPAPSAASPALERLTARASPLAAAAPDVTPSEARRHSEAPAGRDAASGRAMPADATAAKTPTPAAEPTPVDDFDRVMELITRNEVAYLDEIRDYLRPVREHLAAGTQPADEAATRWAWFAGQAEGALAPIEGLKGPVGRVARVLNG